MKLPALLALCLALSACSLTPAQWRQIAKDTGRAALGAGIPAAIGGITAAQAKNARNIQP